MTAAALTLFDMDRPGDYRCTDPLPSRKAAAAHLSARQTQKKDILKRLLIGPATARDLRDITDGQQNRVSKRLGELEKAGLVEVWRYVPSPGSLPLGEYRLTDAGRRDATLLVGPA